MNAAHVVILLATYNGATFLPEQLASFARQTHRDWSLLWRDDGSSDISVAAVEAFAREVGAGRCTRLEAPAERLGACGSFLVLLRAAVPHLGPGDAVAFADQDDVWLPEKLARGVAALADVPEGEPALYCARQVLVDAALRPIGESPRLRRAPGFPAALAENIAAGCTILLNRAAAVFVAESRAPATTLHDWWSYIMVAAAGGRVIADATPMVLYRQHGANAVGAPRSRWHHAVAALRRGRERPMRDLRAHLDALAAQPELLSPAARAQVNRLRRAMAGGALARVRAAFLPGLTRQSAAETLLFRLWLVLG
jgi:glycosyltransferase involved in cell wall biosynthesis